MAKDGVEALNMFYSAPFAYDLILMDVQMPNMDGYTATEKIRKSGLPRATDIPIIALTANAFQEDVDAAFKAGMNGHLIKPIEENKLFAKLSEFLLAPAVEKDIDNVPPALNKTGVDISPELADLKKGLAMSAGNSQFYIRLLKTFVSNDLTGAFLRAVEHGNISEASVHAHTIKGITANLNLKALYDIFNTFDAQFKEQNMPVFNSQDITRLKEVYKNTVDVINVISANPHLLDNLK